jgi:hypothetical protein
MTYRQRQTGTLATISDPDGSGRRITRKQFGFKGTIAGQIKGSGVCVWDGAQRHWKPTQSDGLRILCTLRESASIMGMAMRRD